MDSADRTEQRPGSRAGISRYAALAATAIAFSLAATLSALALGACGSDTRGTPAAGNMPSQTSLAQTPAPVARPEITREQAVAIAEEAFGRDNSLTTAVEGPHDTVTRLMRLRELRGAGSLPVYPTHRDALVWIVQAEGAARGVAGARGEALVYRFNAVVVDAVTGDVIAHLPSEHEPFILPLAFLPEELVNAETVEHSIDRDSLEVTRDQAVQIVIDEHGNDRSHNFAAIETMLLRYSNPLMPGDNAVGPKPTPTTAAHPTATPTTGSHGSPTPVRTPRPTSTPVVDRLSWLVIVPSRLSFGGCFISGPAGEAHFTCWMSVTYFFVDAETGAVLGTGNGGFIGPRVSNDESLALQHFAWAEGWWALWHEVRQYNRVRLPEGLAAQLDRPDAPTPTPWPPTATPPPGSTPTPTPTPAPTATPAPTPVPDSTEVFGQVIAEGDITEGHWRVGGFMRDGGYCVEFHLNGLGRPRCGYTRSHFLTRVPIRLFSDAAILYGFAARDVAVVRVEPGNGESIDLTPVDLGFEWNNFFAVQLGPPLDFSAVAILAIGADGEELYRIENTLESSSARQ